MEEFVNILFGIIFVVLFLYFGFLFVACVTGHLDPSCVHLLSPPPEQWETVGQYTTCH